MSNHFRILNLTVALAAGLALAAVAGRAGAADARPTRSIVLVHGAFADDSSWDRVSPILLARGYTVVAVKQPMSSLADDVAATKRAIDAQPGEVILVGHSYGGVIITEAGNNPKVVGLVYVAAFAPDAGESTDDLGKGWPAPAWVKALKADARGYQRLPPEIVAKDFAQDLPAAEAKLLAAKQTPPHSSVFAAKVKTAAWKTRPAWYVVATEDHMIAQAAQESMAQRMDATTTSIKASHVVMLSKPRQVAAVILTAAAVSPLAASR
jgi:pimeloyl-ACP methyl ester carboxylesterase